MRNRFVVVGALVIGAAASAEAQGLDPQCTDSRLFQQQLEDACQKAVDIFNFMAPQLGTSIAGGNATLGQGGTLGGIGHFSIGLRANALRGSLPQVEEVPIQTTGARASEFPTEAQLVGLPTVDAGVGLFKGFPLGLTNVGGIDLIVSAAYLPELSADNFEVQTPEGSLKFGFGARVGLLQESLALPGVSFTYFMRELPTVNVIAAAGDDRYEVNELTAKTRAWRLVASKSFLVFGLAAGVGQDRYKSSADLEVTVREPGICGIGCSAEAVNFAQEVTRTNYFADLSLNIMLLKLVGEVGLVSGGDIPTYNTFAEKSADDSRLYGSLGLRIGL